MTVDEKTIAKIKQKIRQENKAVDKITELGFLTQGYDFTTKLVAVVKIENENTNNEKSQWFYGKSYYEILQKLQ